MFKKNSLNLKVQKPDILTQVVKIYRLVHDLTIL
jgi:hypothetical protein